MHTGQDYPFDYGFVPQTHWHDGDPLDVVLLTTYPLFSGVLLTARPVAVIDMVDGGASDAKIIAVPTEDPRFNNIKDLKDINPHTVEEIIHFFETYKVIQNKIVTIDGVRGAIEAKSVIQEAVALYKDLPKYITKYIVENTIGKLCEEKKTELKELEERQKEQIKIKQTSAASRDSAKKESFDDKDNDEIGMRGSPIFSLVQLIN